MLSAFLILAQDLTRMALFVITLLIVLFVGSFMGISHAHSQQSLSHAVLMSANLIREIHKTRILF